MQSSTKYKSCLIERYWHYQKSFFPEKERFFQPPHFDASRPPVFLKIEAWRNVITNPQASQAEITKVLDFISQAERHKWFRSMNSSQALAQSVLGNLEVHGLWNSLSNLQCDEGEPLLGQVEITSGTFQMEFPVPVDRFGERRPTSIDGYFPGEYRIAFECKFGEAEIGTCSRPRLSLKNPKYKDEYCDGNYSGKQGRNGRCPLTTIGVRYWDYVPSLFKWPKDNDFFPCPLNRNYQLVRNILAISVNDRSIASAENGHVVLIYDERNPAFQSGGKGLAAYMEIRTALQKPSTLRRCSWQRIISHLRREELLPWLTEHLSRKYGL